jgi:hypothetical protein
VAIRIRLLRFLAIVLLLGSAMGILACNNSQELTDRHERILAEEDEG